jgi:tRNA (adenine-N(1)-)-methyltransferase non-catalytic subunit
MEVDPQAPTSESAPHTGTSLINTDTALIPPTAPSAAATAQVVPTTSDPAEPSSSTGGAKRPHDRSEPSAPLLPMEEVLRRRLTVIQEGDNVLLRLPSDSIKAVVASKQG